MKRIVIVCVLFIFAVMVFSPINAQELIGVDNKSPDFSQEFNGKDTCQKFNRKMFKFNTKLNKYVLKPINVLWASLIPKYGIDRIDSVFDNIAYPKRLVASIMQKDGSAVKTETLRFLANSTLGLGGLYDPAKKIFKIKPKNEDMGQALAHCGVKKGPYLYLPVLGSTNPRDALGRLLEVPLNPSFYLGGPVILGVNGGKVVNETAGYQDVISSVQKAFIDPYEIAKQYYGVQRYTEINNLDRANVHIKENVGQIIGAAINIPDAPIIEPDIKLPNYNPQSSTIDSFRTGLFDKKCKDNSAWLEISVWNRCFNKKLKRGYIKMKPTSEKYAYRYKLQKDKNAPLAIIFPTIGSDVYSNKSVVMAKMFFEEGYSVLITGSNFHWEFLKNTPEDYVPGYLPNDAYYLRVVTAKMIEDMKKRTKREFDKRIVVGTSWGALNSLFIASQEEDDSLLDVSQFISINPPVDLVYAVNQVDKFITDWKKDDMDIKLKCALTLSKISQIAETDYDKVDNISLPLNESEARLLVAITMKQKLSDLVLALEKKSDISKDKLYKKIISMNFYDYMKEYVLHDHIDVVNSLRYKASLYSISDFLENNKKYKIFHAVDDYFVNGEQLKWLKDKAGKKLVLFSNGSHMGYLYRDEFRQELKKEIDLGEATL